jgi:predicted Zn-dependent protease
MEEHCNKLYFMGSLFYWITKTIVLPTMLIWAFSCASHPHYELKPGLTLTAEEMQRGQRGARLLQRTMPPYADQRLNIYVQSILNRIIAALPENDIPFRITILDSTELNAQAFSNGQLFVNRNLLAHLNSESELAGLLAHEVAHIVLRHGTREIKNREKMKQFARRMETKRATKQIRHIADTFGEAMAQGYNREMELEADRFAVKMMCNTGYNPVGMFKLIEILAHKHAVDLEIIQRMGLNPLRYTKGVFNDHPHAGIRMDAIRKDLGYRALRKGISQGDRNRYLKNIEGLAIDNYPADGLVQDGYYLGGAFGVRFKVPNRWSYRLIPGSELSMWPDSQKGTYLHFYALSSKETQNASHPTEDQSDQGLRFEPWRETDELSVNGFEMHLLETNVSDDQRLVKAAIVIGREAEFIFLLVNATADTNRIFNETIESFRVLSADEAHKITVNRITLDAFCPNAGNGPLCVKKREELANSGPAQNINGYFAKGAGPGPGDLIKRITHRAPPGNTDWQ